MMTPLDTLAAVGWPASRLSEALETLTVQSKLNHNPTHLIEVPAINQTDRLYLDHWMQFAAQKLGIEAESVQVPLREVEVFVRQAAPALICLPVVDNTTPVFLALLKRGRKVSVLTPELKIVQVDASVISDALSYPVLSPTIKRDEQFLAQVGIPSERRQQVRKTVVGELYGSIPLLPGWMIRVSPASPMTKQAAQAQLVRPIALILVMQIIAQLLLVITWTIISKHALVTSFDPVWLTAWGLLLFTTIPVQMWIGLNAGMFSKSLGALVKQRLIYGTLNLHPDEIRHEGMGQFLSRILDSEVVEATTISNTFMTIMAFIQIISAFALFILNNGWQLAILLFIWISVICVAGIIDYISSTNWYAVYRRMTNNLVESMVGHRTRLAQQRLDLWHIEEDRLLESYLKLSRRADQMTILQTSVSGTWFIVGLTCIALMSAVYDLTMQTVVISLGGIMLAQQALQTIQTGLNGTIRALQAWQQVKPLFKAAERPQDNPSVLLPLISTTEEQQHKALLIVKNLSFRYRTSDQWVIQNCNLDIYRGDRILLEGPSGGGKTTFAALLAGLREPLSGMLLLHNYDQKSIGLHNWHRHVVIAPQFHENHIFTETFAFNLLLGRGYPPTEADIQEALQICQELGLDDLLKRMPSGFQQMVGEGGWQLSHGERSRVFIARALLQETTLVILDESFGALDAETLQLAMECVLRRASTLIVIAHP